MKILFIVGYCLKVNSSANLCHASYINGFINSGHDVDLLTVSEKGQKIDESINLPNVRNLYTYDCSLYEQYGNRNKSTSTVNTEKNTSESEAIDKPSIKGQIIGKAKLLLRQSYGVYTPDIAWYNRAKSFKSKEQYDLVISLVFPPTSVKLANYLKKTGKVKATKWLQIWEDPWSTDLSCADISEKTKVEEAKLIKTEDKIMYVSPLTMEYQKQIFPESADRMCWLPLPSYYKSNENVLNFGDLTFGYFGDYTSSVRNLQPFLDTIYHNDIDTYICGGTDLSVSSKGNVCINPRLPLNELKEYEDKTNVIVFLCNLKGGQIPGKIYQYSATNKAILFILDGTEEEKKIIKDYFSQFNRYIFCDNNEESIKKAIDSIPELVKNPDYTKPLDNFDSKNIVKAILNEVGM